MSSCAEAYVSALSDGYRTVLLMHDVRGLTAREIGEPLGDSTGQREDAPPPRAQSSRRRALEARG